MDEGTSICSDSHRCENYSICIEYPNNEGLVSGGVDGGPERVEGVVVGVVQQSIQIRDDGIGIFNNGIFALYGRNLVEPQVRERWVNE